MWAYTVQELLVKWQHIFLSSSESGKLLVCGQNHRGQLGLGHVSEVMNFQLCQLPGNRTVRQVSCGWDFTIILTGDVIIQTDVIINLYVCVYIYTVV